MDSNRFEAAEHVLSAKTLSRAFVCHFRLWCGFMALLSITGKDFENLKSDFEKI